MELHAALTGLAPLELSPGLGLPRMPAFERLLARGAPEPAPADWRRWALGLAGMEAPAGDLPVGATLATAAGLAGGEGTWAVLEPVHLIAGLSSVQLHSAGRLTLDAAAAAGLAARYAAELGGEEFRLHAVGSLLLLEARAALEVATVDPEPHAGRDAAPALPTGADAGRLRRLMTELQMWLHERAPRAAEGVPVNALWPWGAGRGALAGAGEWPALESDDGFLQVLARRGTPRVGQRLAEWRYARVHGEAEPLARLDALCFAPLEAALASGALARATLHYAGRSWRLGRLQRLKLWARPQPWWEIGA